MASYLTIAEAQTYFDGRLNTSAWDDETDATTRNKALTMATTTIDRLNFIGAKYDSLQVLQFPRGVDTTVPADIKNATAEVALALLDGVDPEMELENINMTSQGYGGVRSSYDRTIKPAHVLAGIPSSQAWMFLKPYLVDPEEVELYRVN